MLDRMTKSLGRWHGTVRAGAGGLGCSRGARCHRARSHDTFSELRILEPIRRGMRVPGVAGRWGARPTSDRGDPAERNGVLRKGMPALMIRQLAAERSSYRVRGGPRE